MIPLLIPPKPSMHCHFGTMRFTGKTKNHLRQNQRNRNVYGHFVEISEERKVVPRHGLEP